MAAADRTPKTSSPGVVAFITQLFGRSRRRRVGDPGQPRAVPDLTSPTIDLGDLAVAQFVHDLRNQLTVMVASAERIFDLVPRGEVDQEIEELRQRAERASLLTRELLLAVRPRSIARDRVDLNLVVTAATGMLSRFAGEGIRLRVRLPDEPVTVVAQAQELERILLNLTLNACDAMARGGDLTIETEVIVRSTRGEVEPALRPPYARLTVSDTGCGMTPEVQARIFEPFFTTKAKGTGLGLSSLACTVRQLQGTVSVDSAPGRGTSVTVNLPCS